MIGFFSVMVDIIFSNKNMGYRKNFKTISHPRLYHFLEKPFGVNKYINKEHFLQDAEKIPNNVRDITFPATCVICKAKGNAFKSQIHRSVSSASWRQAEVTCISDLDDP